MAAHLCNIVNLKQWVFDVCKKWPTNAEAEDIFVHCTIKVALDALEPIRILHQLFSDLQVIQTISLQQSKM